MKRGISRWAQQALALCAATVLIGCDDFGEKKSLDIQSQAAAMRSAGEGSSDEAVKLLESVAGGSGNSPVLIQAQQSLGQVQLAKADKGAAELASMTSDAGQTLFKIGQLARQARTNVILANNYRQLDPKVSVEQIGETTAKVRGDGNAEAYPIDAAKIPTLAIAQQNKARLDGEITKTQDAIAAATKERDDALAQAGTQSANIDAEKADQRTGTVKLVADMHTKAAAASRQISDLTMQLIRLKAEQAEQAGLVMQLQTAVDTMTTQGTSLSQGWQVLSTKAADQTALAKKIFEADGESVKSLTTSLNAQLKEIDAKRGEVEDLYKNAIASFGKAAEKAGERVRDLNAAKESTKGGAYETAAWETEANLIAVDRMNLDKSGAEKGLADLYAAHAGWLASVLVTSVDVEDVASQLNVAAADPFNADKLRGDLGKTINDANDGYEIVKATLQGAALQSADLSPLKTTKAIRTILTLSDQAALANVAAMTKVSPDVAKKGGADGDFHKDMLAAATEAKESNISLPALPMSLGGIVAPTTAPAATEASVPAAGEPSAAAEDAAVAPVRDAFKHMLELLEAGNTGELKTGSILEEGGDAEIQDWIDVMKKIGHFRTAAEPKFGTDAGYQVLMTNLPSSKATPAASKFKIDGDKARVEPVVEGDREDFRLVEGAWKPVFGTPVTDQTNKMKASNKAAVDALDQAAIEIEAGTLTDFAEIMKRVQAAMQGGDSGPASMPAAESPAAPAPAPAPAAPAQ